MTKGENYVHVCRLGVKPHLAIYRCHLAMGGQRPLRLSFFTWKQEY
jgi:hypothetical protein